MHQRVGATDPRPTHPFPCMHGAHDQRGSGQRRAGPLPLHAWRKPPHYRYTPLHTRRGRSGNLGCRGQHRGARQRDPFCVDVVLPAPRVPQNDAFRQLCNLFATLYILPCLRPLPAFWLAECERCRNIPPLLFSFSCLFSSPCRVIRAVMGAFLDRPPAPMAVFAWPAEFGWIGVGLSMAGSPSQGGILSFHTAKRWTSMLDLAFGSPVC